MNFVALLIVSCVVALFVYLRRNQSRRLQDTEMSHSDGVAVGNVQLHQDAVNVFPFVNRIGYFTASNDEKGEKTYVPTSLQDIEPNDYA